MAKASWNFDLNAFIFSLPEQYRIFHTVVVEMMHLERLVVCYSVNVEYAQVDAVVLVDCD